MSVDISSIPDLPLGWSNEETATELAMSWPARVRFDAVRKPLGSFNQARWQAQLIKRTLQLLEREPKLDLGEGEG